MRSSISDSGCPAVLCSETQPVGVQERRSVEQTSEMHTHPVESWDKCLSWLRNNSCQRSALWRALFYLWKIHQNVSHQERFNKQTNRFNNATFWIALHNMSPFSCENLFLHIMTKLANTKQMSCVAAAAPLLWSLFSIWLAMQREACTQDNEADGRWRFVLGMWKPVSPTVDGSTVMPGQTHEKMPGSGV